MSLFIQILQKAERSFKPRHTAGNMSSQWKFDRNLQPICKTLEIETRTDSKIGSAKWP